jgi:hypothetical protein
MVSLESSLPQITKLCIHSNPARIAPTRKVPFQSQLLNQVKMCTFFIPLNKGQQTFSVKDHMANILGFVDHTVSVETLNSVLIV